jgi:hypothetical protein
MGAVKDGTGDGAFEGPSDSGTTLSGLSGFIRPLACAWVLARGMGMAGERGGGVADSALAALLRDGRVEVVAEAGAGAGAVDALLPVFSTAISSALPRTS